MQNRIPLITAIVFAMIALGGILHLLKRDESNEYTVSVVAAARQLPPGHVISRADLRFVPIPVGVYRSTPGFLDSEQVGMLLGKETALGLAAGEVLVRSALKPESAGGNNRFSKVIPPGMRAISIPIQDRGGVANFLRPGDRVDILANLEIPKVEIRTITVPNEGIQQFEEVVNEPTTVFLLENVALLAVGDRHQSLDFEKGSGGRGSVTISATPEQAQRLSFASTSGRSRGASDVTFTVLLRPEGDPGGEVPRRVVGYEDILAMTRTQ